MLMQAFGGGTSVEVEVEARLKLFVFVYQVIAQYRWAHEQIF